MGSNNKPSLFDHLWEVHDARQEEAALLAQLEAIRARRMDAEREVRHILSELPAGLIIIGPGNSGWKLDGCTLRNVPVRFAHEVLNTEDEPAPDETDDDEEVHRLEPDDDADSGPDDDDDEAEASSSWHNYRVPDGADAAAEGRFLAATPDRRP